MAFGILHSLLQAAGIASQPRSYNLAFAEHLLRSTQTSPTPFTFADYATILRGASEHAAGDWVFAIPPFRQPAPDDDATYLQLLQESGVDEGLIDKVCLARSLVPGFIERCVDELLALNPSFVGFTTTFCQNVPSLLLASVLKERAPNLPIVFGGANCDGSMGKVLFESFRFIDVVVQGEAEHLIVQLAKELTAGGPVSPRPGILTRESDSNTPSSFALTEEMDEVPTPNYDFFFDELNRSDLRDEILPAVELPIETARGCWWGQKHHCTFCGLNPQSMKFRSKSVLRAHREFSELASRYQCVDFTAVDNIIDVGYLRELLPLLSADGIDFRIFYETKANLTKAQIRRLSESGIRRIQPGIESLSTPILKLMRKGVSAWQNVRLLKWCAQYGVRPEWNLIYGFPGEPADEYAQMARTVRSLTHLRPPRLNKMRLQRFSPYHQRPEEFGINVTGPQFHYRFVYPLGQAELTELAYYFDFEHADGREPEDYIGEIRDAVDDWNASHDRDRGALSYRRGPEFIRITDSRRSAGYVRYVLENDQMDAYLACDSGATVSGVGRALERAGHRQVPASQLETFLRELVEAGLMFESDGRFVSLALPDDPAREDRVEDGRSAQRAQPARAQAGARAKDRRALPVLG